jgi:hypothetical protein
MNNDLFGTGIRLTAHGQSWRPPIRLCSRALYNRNGVCWAILPSLIFIASQSAFSAPDDGSWHCYAAAQQHIIVIQGKGQPMQPTVTRRKLPNGQWQYKAHLDKFRKPAPTPTPTPGYPCQVLPAPPEDYQKYVDGILNNIKDTGSKRLLFFIHGGMNYPKGAAEHAAWLLGQSEEKDPDFDLSSTGYPIFICWESPPTGYFEQVTWVRAGRSERYGESVGHKFYALITLPFHIFADFGRGFTRFPAELSEFAHNDIYSMDPKPFSEFETLGREAAYLNSCPQGNVHISSEPLVRNTFARCVENAETAFVFPFRTLTLPIIDSLGVSDWENMLRHTDTMFDRTDTEKHKHPTPVEEAVERDQTGALAIFFTRLQGRSDLNQLPITLVGHSMGAIVSNRIVSGYPQLTYRNIVYMGAACSVREFQASVIPYMTQHSCTRFYNLSLHPQCEAGEVALSPQKFKLDIAPRGSLLVWLDNIFTRPPSEDERRFGIFQTAVLSSHNFPPAVRTQITLKCFDFGGVEPRPNLIWHPQHHADFARSPFWNPTFWKPNGSPPSAAPIAQNGR